MKKFFIILPCIILGFLLGCTFYLFTYNPIPHTYAPTVDTLVTQDEINLENIIEDSPTISPYTGLALNKYQNENTPFLCVVENSINSRPQSGLSEADILYETMAEGGIPIFLALFHSNSPVSIGPIRSVKPHFIDISKEYNLPFVHCGGSGEALSAVSVDKSINSLNEANEQNYFWRDSSKKSPHNLYTSASKMNNFIEKNSYSYNFSSSLSFDKLSWFNESLGDANGINLILNSYYTTSYKYSNGVYEKYMDGNIAVDVNNNKSLTFTNVIIQQTDIKSPNDNKYIDYNLVGTGEGFIFSNGKVQKILWIKSSIDSPTILRTVQGDILPLNPGNTIWHIVDNSAKLAFE